MKCATIASMLARCIVALALSTLVSACGSTDARRAMVRETRPNTDGGASSSSTRSGVRPSFCSRPGDDPVRDVFCNDETPIKSLRDLQDALAVPYADDTLHGISTFMGHSTSLSGRVVSPMNPRVIMNRIDARRPGDSALLAFQRGEQRVEMAARARGGRVFEFYLLTFTQACNTSVGGCLPGDLYTPAIETKWLDVEVRDDEDLKDTPSDCRQCHQRARATPVVLMRELDSPWMHFFEQPPDDEFQVSNQDRSGSMALERAFQAAKGDEEYANFSASAIRASAVSAITGVADSSQPLLFDSEAIIDERLPPSAPEGTAPGRSPTWDSAYETFKRGEHLALPYFDPNPTDPGKLAALTAAYRSYLAGATTAAELPDLADIFPDDPQVRAEIGLQTEPDATPAATLIQACCPCHNDVLDQTLSRAKFNVDLSRLDRAELASAADRIGRASVESGAMPPPDVRQLDPTMRQRLIDYLTSGNFSDSDLEMLAHAAQAGMAGDAQ